MALAQGFQNLVAAVPQLFQHVGADAVLLEEFGGALGGLDVEAQVVEAADQGQGLLLVLIGHSGKHGAVVLQVGAGGLQGLIQGTVQLVVIADGLAGGLHLRGQVGIQAADLIEGEHRHLHIPAVLFFGIDVEDALLLQALAQDDLGGDIRQAVAGGLGQEGNGAGGAGIDLDDIDLLVLVHDELDIVQAHDADAQAQLLGVLQDDALHLVGNAEGGVDTDGVAAVDAGALHQLHNAGDEHIPAIADGVHLDLLADDVFIHQHRLIHVHLHGGL